MLERPLGDLRLRPLDTSLAILDTEFDVERRYTGLGKVEVV